MCILLNADEANEINDEVKTQISPNLFIFCNYSPIPSEITNDTGGLFLLKLNNFYRLLVDSGWVIKKLAYIYSGQEGCDLSALPFSKPDIDNIYNTLSDLRTVFCHNITLHNGEDSIINNVRKWFSQHMESNIVDFHDCINQIDNDAKTIIDICSVFINGVKTLSDIEREAVIDRWKSAIIEHYKKKHDIFLNMLGKYYLVKHAQISPQNYYKFKQTTIKETLLSYFTYDIKQFRDKINNLPVKDPNKLNPVIKSINDIEQQRAHDLSGTKDINLLYPKTKEDKDNLIDLFFDKELEKVINDTLKSSRDCSLLPQHIFNEVFDKAETHFGDFNFSFKRFEI